LANDINIYKTHQYMLYSNKAYILRDLHPLKGMSMIYSETNQSERVSRFLTAHQHN